MRPILLMTAGCILLAGCAQIEERGRERRAAAQYAPANASTDAPDCFLARSIEGYGNVDADTVRVRVGLRDYYDVTVTPACMNLELASGVAVVSRSLNLCVNRGAGQGDVVAGGERCPILNIAHSIPAPAGGGS